MLVSIVDLFLAFLVQSNETQELEELKKSSEQTEARLNIQISSLNENLSAARAEAEAIQRKTRETELKATAAEKQCDDLRGDIAGKNIFFNEENLLSVGEQNGETL